MINYALARSFLSLLPSFVCVKKRKEGRKHTQPTVTTSTRPEAPLSSQEVRRRLLHLLSFPKVHLGFPKLQAFARKWGLGDSPAPRGTRLSHRFARQPARNSYHSPPCRGADFNPGQTDGQKARLRPAIAGAAVSWRPNVGWRGPPRPGVAGARCGAGKVTTAPD